MDYNAAVPRTLQWWTSLLMLLACRNNGSARDAATQIGQDRPASPEDLSAGTDGSFPEAPFSAADAPGIDTASDASVADVPRCNGICNAVTPRNPTVGASGGSGNVTMYTTSASSGGACNYGNTGVLYFVAVNVNVAPGDGQGQWQQGRICGQCALVTAVTSQGPQSVVVRIMDKCPDGSCGMDLGGDAPSAIMLDGFGRYDGWWQLVSCAGHPEVSDGVPSLFVLAGSNAWWARVQIRNPPWSVDSIDWQDTSGPAHGSFAYASDPENTFEVPTDVLQSEAAIILITVRYGDATQATVRLSPAALATGSASYPLEP